MKTLLWHNLSEFKKQEYFRHWNKNTICRRATERCSSNLCLAAIIAGELMWFYYLRGREGTHFEIFLYFLRKVRYVSMNFRKSIFAITVAITKKLYGLLPSLCKAILGYFRTHFCPLSSFPCLEKLKIFS